MSSSFIELSKVSYRIGARTILFDVDVKLEAGRIYGLIGPNGSGKSTLLKTIARQIIPTGGVIAVNGKSLADWPTRAFARHIAYMPQFTPAVDGMTVRELVALGRFPWHGTLGRFTDADRKAVEEAIERTELSEFADRSVAGMSGGERQRAWIAMMLAQDARCLLMDEPTSALDLAHQASVLSLVHSLSRERGLAVVIVLHDVNLAARYCDRIFALNFGRITAEGEPAEIMTPKTLNDIFHIGMGVFSHPERQEPVSYLL